MYIVLELIVHPPVLQVHVLEPLLRKSWGCYCPTNELVRCDQEVKFHERMSQRERFGFKHQSFEPCNFHIKMQAQSWKPQRMKLTCRSWLFQHRWLLWASTCGGRKPARSLVDDNHWRCWRGISLGSLSYTSLSSLTNKMKFFLSWGEPPLLAGYSQSRSRPRGK